MFVPKHPLQYKTARAINASEVYYRPDLLGWIMVVTRSRFTTSTEILYAVSDCLFILCVHVSTFFLWGEGEVENSYTRYAGLSHLGIRCLI